MASTARGGLLDGRAADIDNLIDARLRHACCTVTHCHPKHPRLAWVLP